MYSLNHKTQSTHKTQTSSSGNGWLNIKRNSEKSNSSRRCKGRGSYSTNEMVVVFVRGSRLLHWVEISCGSTSFRAPNITKHYSNYDLCEVHDIWVGYQNPTKETAEESCGGAGEEEDWVCLETRVHEGRKVRWGTSGTRNLRK